MRHRMTDCIRGLTVSCCDAMHQTNEPPRSRQLRMGAVSLEQRNGLLRRAQSRVTPVARLRAEEPHSHSEQLSRCRNPLFSCLFGAGLRLIEQYGIQRSLLRHACRRDRKRGDQRWKVDVPHRVRPRHRPRQSGRAL